MEEAKHNRPQERCAAGEEESESKIQQKGGVADKSKGLDQKGLGSEGKTDRNARMTE
jgi:hypothetical protein